jgi:RHS repeat-associated protein
LDRYAYTGREWDAGLSLYYYRARLYSADAGRFLSEDPTRFAAGDPNLYRYAGNGPTNATDPSGLQGAPEVVEMPEQRRDRLAAEIRDIQQRMDDFSGRPSFGNNEVLRGLQAELSAKQKALDDLTWTLRLIDKMRVQPNQHAGSSGPKWDSRAHAAALRVLGVPDGEAQRTAERFGREFDYHAGVMIVGLNRDMPVLVENSLRAIEAMGYVAGIAGGVTLSLTGYGAVVGAPLAAWSGDQLQAMVLSPLDGPRRQTYTSRRIAGVAGYVDPTLTPRERYAWGEAGNIVVGVGLSAGTAGSGRLLTRQAKLAPHSRLKGMTSVEGEFPRSTAALSPADRNEIVQYLKELGMDVEKGNRKFVFRTPRPYGTSPGTAYGATEDILSIGVNVNPATAKEIEDLGLLFTLRKHSELSHRAVLAHEIVGHRGAEVAGMGFNRTTELGYFLDEAQAHIRAALHAPGLTDAERSALWVAGFERLQSAGLRYADIKNMLYLERGNWANWGVKPPDTVREPNLGK